MKETVSTSTRLALFASICLFLTVPSVWHPGFCVILIDWFHVHWHYIPTVFLNSNCLKFKYIEKTPHTKYHYLHNVLVHQRKQTWRFFIFLKSVVWYKTVQISALTSCTICLYLNIMQFQKYFVTCWSIFFLSHHGHCYFYYRLISLCACFV